MNYGMMTMENKTFSGDGQNEKKDENVHCLQPLKRQNKLFSNMTNMTYIYLWEGALKISLPECLFAQARKEKKSSIPVKLKACF